MAETLQQSFDVTIVGAGITGLMLTKKLSELGMSVALLEKESQLAGGPSTRNEGWLHRGTYHASSIADQVTAVQVARRCIYGHEQIRGFAPEAIEDVDTASYALVRDADKAEQAIGRWDAAGVAYKEVRPEDVKAAEPNVRTEGVMAAFETRDVGVNTRVLYRKLLHAGRRAGAVVLPGAQLSIGVSGEALVSREATVEPLDSQIFAYTAGYGIRDIFMSNFGIDIPLRYWKSHLMVTPRLTQASVFYLDSHEAAMINHGDYSIVGLNEDAVVCESPDTEVVPENVELLHAAIQRLFRKSSGDEALPLACIKTDLSERSAAARSLNISVTEPLPGHLCVLPGKMTETPYVTDVVSRLIAERLGDDMIALRPVDSIRV